MGAQYMKPKSRCRYRIAHIALQCHVTNLGRCHAYASITAPPSIWPAAAAASSSRPSARRQASIIMKRGINILSYADVARRRLHRRLPSSNRTAASTKIQAQIYRHEELAWRRVRTPERSRSINYQYAQANKRNKAENGERAGYDFVRYGEIPTGDLETCGGETASSKSQPSDHCRTVYGAENRARKTAPSMRRASVRQCAPSSCAAGVNLATYKEAPAGNCELTAGTVDTIFDWRRGIVLIDAGSVSMSVDISPWCAPPRIYGIMKVATDDKSLPSRW